MVSRRGVCQNLLVPALDAGTQKDRPSQSDFYRVGFNAIPRQAREQDSFDTPSMKIKFALPDSMGRAEPCPYKYTMLVNQTLYVPEIVLPPSPVQLV